MKTQNKSNQINLTQCKENFENINRKASDLIIAEYFGDNYDTRNSKDSCDFITNNLNYEEKIKLYGSAMNQNNSERIRYANIFPHKNTQIELSPKEIKKLDFTACLRDNSRDINKIETKKFNKYFFVNANHIKFDYINTQAILSDAPNALAIPSFFEMILQKKTTLVVCLTNMNDLDKGKVISYWDENIGNKYLFSSKINITNIEKKNTGIYENMPTSKIKILDEEKNNSFEFFHINYLVWEDSGCPKDNESILNLYNEMKKYNCDCPIIHCSAGVGRSGTLIIISYILDILSHIGQEDFYFKSVQEVIDYIPSAIIYLKKSRHIMCVQKSEQYDYIYKFFGWYIENKF
jgi:protein tyrosine phosphatase